jgi:hypothetical protein
MSIKQEGLGSSASLLVHTLVNLYDRIFLISQSFLPVVNGLLLGTLLFQSKLVPRWLPLIGIFGAFLLMLGDGLVIFGSMGQHDPMTALFAVPIAFWEFSLGIYLLLNGISRFLKHTQDV